MAAEAIAGAVMAAEVGKTTEGEWEYTTVERYAKEREGRG